MNNCNFLHNIGSFFIKCLQTHSRSNEKLKILHSSIAKDISEKLGDEYIIKSLGLGEGREGKLKGRYFEKTVDILISKDDEALAGVGVKFVMNNYAQNSNNYFENMLGETANIRCNGKAYFQIIIIPDEMPYYKQKGEISKWETITKHNIDKYIALSKDDTGRFLHTPLKTLLYIIKLPICDKALIKTKKAYNNYYIKLKKNIVVIESDNIAGDFGNEIILNDYEKFIEKIVYYIKSM